MGARIVAGRAYAAGVEPNSSGPWIATSDGVTVRMSSDWNGFEVLNWLKIHFPEALTIHIREDDGSDIRWRFITMSDPAMVPFIDRVMKSLYGRTRTESIQNGICVMCGTELGDKAPEEVVEEFNISGLCESCQKKVFVFE